MMSTLNTIYSPLTTRRRYEVWFLRIGLADFGGAWWFRYLLMNPGRGGCPGNPRGMPVQLWATWFPCDGAPQTWIQGFPLEDLRLSGRGDPLLFRVGEGEIGEDSCRGVLDIDGHRIRWDLRYSSSFATTLSNKGWIGFSRTPHSDARFSGKIVLDGRSFEGDPLGFGVQGHNCGYRHRRFWRWAHAYFGGVAGQSSTIEALIYDMPFGLVFRKAVLWHDGKQHVFRNLRERFDHEKFAWSFSCAGRDGMKLEVLVDGRGPGIHRLPYLNTDCSGCFEVMNNSLSKATLRLKWSDGRMEELHTIHGAVLENVARQK